MVVAKKNPGTDDGVDVDPTKNVLDLVEAESKYQDARRNDLEKLLNAKGDAETRRINELAALRGSYETILEGMRQKQADTVSALLSTQIREATNGLPDRVSELEQFRWESGGKTSVLDPATASQLNDINHRVRAIRIEESKIEGRAVGQREVIAWVIAAAAAIVAYLNYAK